MEFGVSSDDIESKKTKRRDDDNDKENEIEIDIEGDGDSNHMKESQEEEEEGSTEMQAGPGGFAGLIANLSGVIWSKNSVFCWIFQQYDTFHSFTLGWPRFWCWCCFR